MLVRVLDGIRSEAAGTRFAARYAVGATEIDDVWQARSRAYVHLYLKVMFGITDFEEREQYVTDGKQDGGIDGYFIDMNIRTIFLIQSKFRNTEENFENKPITLDELLSMQIKRVLGGQETDEKGIKYNGKILGLQRRIAEILDIGRYKPQVLILANIKPVSSETLLRLTDGYLVEIVSFDKAYKDLLYPVLSGTLFRANGLSLSVDISNKSAGTKIAYSVLSNEYQCDITVVFVPTIEIAKIMSRYKNSILRYNPRSYLELEGAKVNHAITETILSPDSNEFAILNNGITIVCDESSISEQSGRLHRAQLYLVNPQIINGGQTAYTLSRIYDRMGPDKREEVFSGKEVLVKAIALTNRGDAMTDEERRIAFIERISMATNSQTLVTNADRKSGDVLHSQLQTALFEWYGLLYERKRGEFSDGIADGYIAAKDVVNRVLFARLFYAANGNVSQALTKRILDRHQLGILEERTKLDRCIAALGAFEALSGGKNVISKRRFTEILPKVYAASIVFRRRCRSERPSRQGGGCSKTCAESMGVICRLCSARRCSLHSYDCAPDNG